MDCCNSSPKIYPRTASALTYRSSRKPGVRDHLGELWLDGEPANRLDQVLVRVTVSRKYCPQHRNDRKRVLIIQTVNLLSQSAVSDRVTKDPSRIQCGVRHLAELEACKCAPRFEDAMGLPQHCRYRRAISDTKCNGIEIICV